jgi:hypothetical protein
MGCIALTGAVAVRLRARTVKISTAIRFIIDFLQFRLYVESPRTEDQSSERAQSAPEAKVDFVIPRFGRTRDIADDPIPSILIIS